MPIAIQFPVKLFGVPKLSSGLSRDKTTISEKGSLSTIVLVPGSLTRSRLLRCSGNGSRRRARSDGQLQLVLGARRGSLQNKTRNSITGTIVCKNSRQSPRGTRGQKLRPTFRSQKFVRFTLFRPGGPRTSAGTLGEGGTGGGGAV